MRYFKDIYGLFFPKICACCATVLVSGEKEICLNCLIDLPFTNFSESPNNAMEQVFQGRIPIEFGASLLYYQPKGKSQDLIFELKYRGQQKIGSWMGDLLFEQLIKSDRLPQFDMIIPVPLHKDKLKKRGYNQVSTFGLCLAKHLKIPYNDQLLFRKKGSFSQTKKNRRERFRNFEGQFFIQKGKEIGHTHILLIDDVLTTGATLEACALALLCEKVKISIITIAYTG